MNAPYPNEARSDAGGTALRIGYLPYGGITNRYAERFIEILAPLGTVCDLPRPRQLLRRPAGLRRAFDLAMLNWIELDVVRDGAFSPAGFLKVLGRVLYYKCIARRVAYVRHNNFPHGTRERDQARARRAIDLIERLCDVVLTHSGHQPEARRRYLPHPLYRPAAALPDADELRLLAAHPPGYYVVFGRIARYKRIETLIEAFPPGRRLLVCGAVEEPDYAEQLRRMARPGVSVLAGELSEALAQALVRRARALVLAHAERDMIVSGSLFYALSLGTRVLAVSTPALEWLRPRVGDELLGLAPDVAALCERIGGEEAPPPAPTRRPARLEAEFGDARIRTVLREVLA